MATILPDGWFSKENEDGNTYYYDVKGRVSWLPPPPRPLAPIKIITFKEEYSTVAAIEEEEEEEYYDKWVVDEDDVGLPIKFPSKTAHVAQRIGEECEVMRASNRKIAGRFEVNAHTWGGEPHPRLGSGERMRLGYRPPPPWQATDTVASTTKSVSKNANREWVVEGPKTVNVPPTDVYLVRAPMGGFHGTVVQVVSSDEHSYLRTSEGLVYSWGRNVFGQLGLGDVETRAVPCLVTSIAEDWVVTHLSCGGSHALALTKARKNSSSDDNASGDSSPKYGALENDGQMLWSWGKGRDGALGLGVLFDRHVPQIVHSLSDIPIVSCSAGATNSLAATETGELYSWGNNIRGLCGLGDSPRTRSAAVLASRLSQSHIHGDGSRPDTGYSNSGYSTASTSKPTTRPGTSGSQANKKKSPRPETSEDSPSTQTPIDAVDSLLKLTGEGKLIASDPSLVSYQLSKFDEESDPSLNPHLCVASPTKCTTVTKGVKLVCCGKFHSIVVCNKLDAEECLVKALSARRSRRKAEKKRLEKAEKKRAKAERASIAAANSKRRWSRKKTQVVPNEESSDEEDEKVDKNQSLSLESGGQEGMVKSIKDSEQANSQEQVHDSGVEEVKDSVSAIGSIGSTMSADTAASPSTSNNNMLVLDIEGNSSRDETFKTINHSQQVGDEFAQSGDITLNPSFGSIGGSLLFSSMSLSTSALEFEEEEFLDGFGPETRGSLEEVEDHMGEIKSKKLSYQGEEVVLLTWGYGDRAALGLGIENTHLDVDVPTILPVPIGDEVAPWVVPPKNYKGRFDVEEVLSVEASCHSVLLTASGGGLETHVYTWGDADHGKCGVEPPKTSKVGPIVATSVAEPNFCVPSAVHVPTKVKDFEGKQVVCITAGGFATCASTADGKVYACGFVGNGVTMDRVAQQREVLDIPRPRQLVELTEPRYEWKGVDVVDVQLGMRHAIVITAHRGCLRELTILDNIDHITKKFQPVIESMYKQVDLQVETITNLQHAFDAIVPDSAQLLQPLLNEAYERGLNGHTIVVAGEKFESSMADLRSYILSANDNILKKYLCCCKEWSAHLVKKPPALQRRQKRLHKSKSSKPKGPKDGRSKGDPNFNDGALIK